MSAGPVGILLSRFSWNARRALEAEITIVERWWPKMARAAALANLRAVLADPRRMRWYSAAHRMVLAGALGSLLCYVVWEASGLASVTPEELATFAPTALWLSLSVALAGLASSLLLLIGALLGAWAVRRASTKARTEASA